jgi:thymidylate synthase (FAD)
MSDGVVFKTIQECGLALIEHSTWSNEMREELIQNGKGDLPLDYLTVKAARASFGKDDKTGDNKKADDRLIDRLAEDGHFRCHEYNHATFVVEAPLFVLAQIKEHRSLYNLTMATNSTSRRYTSEQLGFWIPDKWRKQSSSNKQASTDEAVESMVVTDHVVREKWVDDPMRVYTNQVKASLWLYEDMLESGICREQARAVLPQSLLTRFYLGGNLREWAMFLKLRTAKEGVQFETRYVAERIEKALRKLWPVATEKLFNQRKKED